MIFRKKPVEIEARQVVGVDEEDVRAVAGWCGGSAVKHDDGLWGVIIDTLEGRMTAQSGDWIIRGVQGEFYPCKPGIFVETYEFVEDR